MQDQPTEKLCECGCGQPTALAKRTSRKEGKIAGEPNRFVNRHHKRKGGVYIDKKRGRGSGRAKIVCRDGSTTYFYRAVMEAELRRPLRFDEQVHHKNGDHTDDRPENLEVLTPLEHKARHRPTHCRRGHLLEGANVYVVPSSGYRQCVTCRHLRRGTTPPWEQDAA